MATTSTLSILAGNLNTPLTFESVFAHILDSLDTLGAYSDINTNSEKYLNRTAIFQFCKIVHGTVYGHFPILVPHPTNDNNYILRSPFFHFSTLKEENIENADKVMSIQLDADKQSGIFLMLIAEHLISKGYRAFFKLSSTSSDSPIELTKESIHRYK